MLNERLRGGSLVSRTGLDKGKSPPGVVTTKAETEVPTPHRNEFPGDWNDGFASPPKLETRVRSSSSAIPENISNTTEEARCPVSN